MAFAFVQEQINTAVPGSSVVVNATQGWVATIHLNAVIVNLKFTVATPSAVSVTDSAGNTYVQVGTVGTIAGAAGCVLYQFAGVQVIGGSTSITASWTGATVDAKMTCTEMSGGATTNATLFTSMSGSVANHAAATTGALSSALTPTSGQLIVALYGLAGATTTATHGTNYLIAADESFPASGVVEYNTSSTTSETAPMTWSTSEAWNLLVGAYNLPSATTPNSGFFAFM